MYIIKHLYILLFVFLVSCSPAPKKLVIGVSQCSEDIWRDKQNDELRMGAYFHDNVELRFTAAYDSDERQVQQIDSLVNAGIDLLIVAPNQVATISPAIDRAYDRGIPVIVFERKTNSQKYTAFMSADNYEMGRVMGTYIAQQMHGQGHVMEVMGLKGSSPAIERHKGFTDAMKSYPGVKIIATLQGDWTDESAYRAVKDCQEDLSHVDYVFGQNDRMAMGARKALLETHRSPGARYCGIDGLSGEGGGIQLVRDSVLDASYIYPTHGDKLLQLAVDILEGKPYKKETALMSALVTRENAAVLMMQNEEISRRSDYLDSLHAMANEYLSQLDTQRTITLMACGIIALLLVVMLLFYLYHRGKITLRRQREVNTLWNMETVDSPLEESPSSVTEETVSHSEQDVPSEDTEDNIGGRMFVAKFKHVVENRLSDSELSVDDLAVSMNLSRVQLYRKIKAVTGSSPVELLRTARLNRAYQMLMTTDKTVSEVAYAVGFTSPSYFTKCFKDEYGKVPGDIRK